MGETVALPIVTDPGREDINNNGTTDENQIRCRSARRHDSRGFNRWSGGYKLSGQSLEFGPLITMRRAGPPEAMQMEHEFTRALESATQIDDDGERIILSNGGKELLVF